MPSARPSLPGNLAGAAVAPRPRVPEDNAAAIWSTVESALVRLEEAVEQETAALRARASVDLKEFHERKSQGLLELTRAMRHIDGGTPTPSLMQRLSSLRARLETNSALLKLHLDAVREISAVMTDAIRDAESDGTYSRPIHNSGAKRV
jgi:hypothetical protein